jgi:hypothetical protein
MKGAAAMAQEKQDRQTTKRSARLEDLEEPVQALSDEDSDKVQGGRKAGGTQQEYLVVTMSDVLIS